MINEKPRPELPKQDTIPPMPGRVIPKPMTALITLTDNIIAPNGEEYRAVWGTRKGISEHFETIGDVVINLRHVISLVPCPRPKKDTTPYTETKNGRIMHEPQVSDFPHIYYAE